MSYTIDEKIVEMRFDNDQFEKNVNQSLDTINKLNDGVSGLSNVASKGFENIDKHSSKLNLSTLSDGIGAVSDRFSALETIATGALLRIGQQAVDATERLLKSLTILPIKQGFDEYELKMGAVQTIMASTGEDLSVINAYLDELNTYADKTIYSFSDMTQNIGKFTNNGVKLDDAVLAIQGVSNAAALAGANSAEASRAMYNFSQALSQGSVKLIDWKSIANANMATQSFKQNLIDTAVALGTVSKEGNKYVTVTTDAKGKVSDLFDANDRFDMSLAHSWMTTEVLIQTLRNYSTDVREMTEVEKEAYEEQLKGIGYTEEQIKGIEELGMKAFDAAQDIKTYTQMIDTLKEAVGSGWSNTFEIVFGDFEEAKKLWTGVGNYIGDIINNMSKSRNAKLLRWDDLGGRSAMIKAFSNIFTNLFNILGAVRDSFRDFFPEITGDQLARFSKWFLHLSESIKLSDESLEKLKRALKAIWSPLKLVKDLVVTIVHAISPFISMTGRFAKSLLNYAADIGDAVNNAIIYIRKSGFLDEVKKRTTEAVDVMVSYFKTFKQVAIDSFTEVGGGLGGIVNVIYTSIYNFVKSIVDTISKIIGVDLYDKMHLIFDIFEILGDIVVGCASRVEHAGSTIVDAMSRMVSAIKDALNKSGLPDLFGNIRDSLNDMFDNMVNTFESFKYVNLDPVEEVADRITLAFTPFQAIFDGLAKIFGWIQKAVEHLKPVFKWVGDGIGSIVESIFDAIQVAFGEDGISGVIAFITSSLWATAIYRLTNFFDTFSEGIYDVGHSIGGIGDAIDSITGGWKNVVKSITGILDGVRDSLVAYQNTLKAKSLLLIAIAMGVLAASMVALSKIDAEQLGVVMTAMATDYIIIVQMAKHAFELFSLFAGNISMIMAGSTAMILMVEALLLMTDAVVKLGKLDSMEVIRGSIAIRIVVNILDVFVTDLATVLAKENPTGMVTAMFAMIPLATAILIFGEAIENIGKLSLAEGVKGIGIIFVLLAALDQFSIDISGTKTFATATGLVVLGSAMLIFGEAIESIGKLKVSEIVKGVGTIMALLQILVMYLKGVEDYFGSIIPISIAIVILSSAIVIFGEAIENIGQLKVSEIVKGLATIFIVFDSLIDFVGAMEGKDAKIFSLSVSMTVIAAAMIIFGEAVENIGKLKTADIIKGVGALFVLTAAIDAFIEDMMAIDTAGLFKVVTSMVVMGTAAVIFAEAISMIGNMKWHQAVQGLAAVVIVIMALDAVATDLDGTKILSASVGLIAMSTALAIIGQMIETVGGMKVTDAIQGVTTFVIVMSMLNDFVMMNDGAKFAAVAAGMLIFSGALVVIAEAIKMIGNMKFLDLLGGLAAFTVILSAMTAAMVLLGDPLLGAGALLAASGMLAMAKAMLIMAPAMKLLGSLGIGEIVLALLAMVTAAAGLAVLGAVLVVLSPLLLLAGVACSSFGAGLILVGKGLLLLEAALVAPLGSVIILLKALIGLLPDLVKGLIEGLIGGLAKGIVELLKAFYDIADALATAFVGLIAAILRGLIESIDVILDALWKLLAELLTGLEAQWPTIVQTLINLVTELLEILDANIDTIVEDTVALIVDFIYELSNEMPKIIAAAMYFVMNLIDGLGQGIEDHAEDFRKTLIRFCKHIWEAILKFFGIHSPSTKMAEVGKNLVLGLAKGIWDTLTWLLGELGKILLKILEVLGSILGYMFKLGKDIVLYIADGIKIVAKTIWESIKSAIMFVVEWFGNLGEYVLELGKTVIGWIVDGIKMVAGNIWEAVKNGVLAIATFFGTIFSTIFDLGKKIIGWIVDGIKMVAGGIWDIVKGAILSIVNHDGSLFTAIFNLGKKIIGWIVDGVKVVAGSIWEAVKSAIMAISDFLSTIWSTIYDVGKKVVGWIVDGIKKVAGTVWDAVKGAFTAITDKIGDIWETVKGWGKKVVGWICDGIKALVSDPWNAVKDALTFIGDKIVGFGATLVGYGKKIFSHIKEGFDEIKGYLSGTIEDELKAAYQVVNGPHGMGEELRQAMKKLGGDMNEGLAKGMEDSMSTVNKQIDNTSSSIVERMKSQNNLNINSPSKVFAAIGASIDEGLAKGIDDYSYYALNSIDGLSTETISAFDDISNAIENIASDNVAYMPTVRPVLDSTNLVGSLADISSINPQAALNLTADLNYNIGDEIASGMRDLVTNNNRMVETLNGVRNDLDELYSVVGNLKVVMDTGALVGQIATPIDYALGKNVRLSGRGV